MDFFESPTKFPFSNSLSKIAYKIVNKRISFDISRYALDSYNGVRITVLRHCNNDYVGMVLEPISKLLRLAILR